MIQHIFYLGVDMISTLIEIFMLYAVSHALGADRGKGIVKYIPYCLSTIMVFVCTWLIPMGLVKVFVIGGFFIISQTLLMKDSVYRCVTVYSLYFVLLMVSEIISVMGIKAVFGYTSIPLGDEIRNIWQVYFLKDLMNLITIILLYKFFDRFKMKLEWKNSFGFLISVFILWILCNDIGNGYFSGRLNWFDSAVGMSVLLFGCMMLMYFLYRKNSIYLKEQNNLAQQQIREMNLKYSYYEEKLRDEERVREIYHDLKNHLLLLQAQPMDNTQSQQMIESLQKQISSFEDYYHTGNEFLDIIIRDKAKKAKEDNIDFNVVIRFEDGGFIESLDISTIFGNAVDNAIEASMKLPAEERLITVKAKRFHDMLSIIIKNNSLPPVQNGLGTSKEDSFLHGFGLKNIQQAVEKYGGEVTIHQDQESFILKIIIPIP